MPSIKDRNDVRASVSNPCGAGGEPLGEPLAPRRVPDPDRSQISERLIEGAVERARLRSMVERPDGERISDEVIDALLAGAKTEQEIAGPGGVLAQLTKRLVERAMEVELTDHLGYEAHHEPPGGAGNTRNGTSPKTLVTEHGRVGIDAPRDRDGSFEPRIVRKRQRRFEGFDDKSVPRTQKEELSRSRVRRMWCCMRDDGSWPGGRVARRGRRAGGGRKPPRGASVKSRGAERRGKGVLSARQVWITKASESEPPMKCRKRIDDIRNRGRVIAPGAAWREPVDWPGGCPAWMVARA